jgi:hypothetical protein
MNIPELPIQFVAVTENMSQGVYTNSTDINSLLLAEGSNLADKLNAHFMTSMSAIPQKCKDLSIGQRIGVNPVGVVIGNLKLDVKKLHSLTKDLNIFKKITTSKMPFGGGKYH